MYFFNAIKKLTHLHAFHFKIALRNSYCVMIGLNAKYSYLPILCICLINVTPHIFLTTFPFSHLPYFLIWFPPLNSFFHWIVSSLEYFPHLYVLWPLALLMYCDLWICKFKKEQFPQELYEEIRDNKFQNIIRIIGSLV